MKVIRSNLDRTLNPQSIAVIGASDRPGSLGYRTMANLNGFSGRLYPVSLRLAQIGEHSCYPTIDDLPEPPDCAVIAVPAAAVEEQVEACARRGTGGCVVFASGYAELDDPQGSAAQDRLRTIARDAGMRLLGPNTTGFAHFASGAHAGFAEFPGGFAEGQKAIALVSQSGALGLALAQSAMHGTGISHVLTCGNSSDLDVADLVTFLTKQAEASAIALVFEGISDPARMIGSVRGAVAGGKPVAVCRVGSTEEGAAAVRWHTGTDPHRTFPWDEALREAGAFLVPEPDALIEAATFLAKTRNLEKTGHLPRLGILSSSGGTGILAADSAARAGLPLARFDTETVRILAKALPSFASPRNPCDATAQATSNPDLIVQCAETILSDANVDALVLPWGKAWDAGSFGTLSDVAAAKGKPICLVWMSQWLEGPGAPAAELRPSLCLFRSMERCMRALSESRR